MPYLGFVTIWLQELGPWWVDVLKERGIITSTNARLFGMLKSHQAQGLVLALFPLLLVLYGAFALIDPFYPPIPSWNGESKQR